MLGEQRDGEAAAAPGPAVVLGLGNPGERYRATRHNLGFRVVEEVARRRDIRLDERSCNALVGRGEGLLLALPQTYMNRSGYAARCLKELHDFDLGRLLVVYDEVALPLGRLRLRPSGGPGGHRGMESVIECLRSDAIARLRVGIAPPQGPPAGEELVEFVLAPFSEEEGETVDEVVGRAAEACLMWLEEGAAPAMNRFNA